MPARDRTARRTIRGALALGVLLAGGCADDDSADPAPGPSAGVTAGSPATDDGGTALRIRVREDGTGVAVEASLSCDPPGGDHPDPDGACALLEDGVTALRPVAPDAVCTQQYGGPQVAEISGTVAGDQVAATVTRSDGCEIARWDTLVPLVPPVR